MKYASLTDPMWSKFPIIKEYLNVIDKHQEYFKDKNIDNIIKVGVHVVGEMEIDIETTNPKIQQKLTYDVRLLKDEGLPKEVLHDLEQISQNIIFVDRF